MELEKVIHIRVSADVYHSLKNKFPNYSTVVRELINNLLYADWDELQIFRYLKECGLLPPHSKFSSRVVNRDSGTEASVRAICALIKNGEYLEAFTLLGRDMSSPEVKKFFEIHYSRSTPSATSPSATSHHPGGTAGSGGSFSPPSPSNQPSAQNQGGGVAPFTSSPPPDSRAGFLPPSSPTQKKEVKEAIE